MITREIHIVFTLKEVEQDIVLSIGSILKRIRDEQNARIQILNTPMIVPPEAPRIIVSINNYNINISLNRIEYVINIPSHICSETIKATKYAIDTINLTINQFYELFKFDWIGIVTHVDYPINNKENSLRASEPLFDRLININRNNKPLASFQIRYGFVEKDLNFNYTINGYDIIDITANEMQDAISKGEQKITETGISVFVDINNKPRIKKDTKVDLFELIDLTLKNIEDISKLIKLGE